MKIVAKSHNEDIATVYIAEMDDGNVVEFVESVQPPIPREEKWVLIVSSLYGCPVQCRFCDAGGFYEGKLSKEDILSQIDFMVAKRFPDRHIPVSKFKIQFARMGEPALNPAVLDALESLPDRYEAPGLLPTISTVAPHGTVDFFSRLREVKHNLYRDRFQLQFSIHSTDEAQRDWLIPIRKWDFTKIADYGESFFDSSGRKVTLNFALAESVEADPKILKEYFDPEVFLIKITPVNPTVRADANKIRSDVPTEKTAYPKVDALKQAGYEVLLSIGELEENKIGSNCGQYIMNYLRESYPVDGGYTYPLK